MKYIIELEPIKGTELYKAKGCNTLVFDKNGIDKILKPLECEFKKDELVEVSNDGIDWKLRYFSMMNKDKYYAFIDGKKSTEAECECVWKYCRKYIKPLEEKAEEYPFKKDELVEVSNNGVYWSLQYFSRIYNGIYYTFVDGKKSTETDEDRIWMYCRKYGTFKENREK